ncbi:MAG: hypothetical protein ACYS9H_07155 [Planctomycetota bacterium]
MAQKKQPELIVLLVMFLSALLVIVSATGMFFNELAGNIFIGSSIMLSASLVYTLGRV